MSEELIREVDEAVKRESAAATWKRLAPFVYGAIALVIIGVAGVEFWKWQSAKHVEARAVAYADALKAMEDGEADKAREQLAAVGEGDDGFAVLANQMLGGLEVDLGKPDEAAAAFMAASDQSDDVLGDIALLKAAYVKADALDRSELEKMVQPLVSTGGPLGALASELLAAKALADGDVERARREYRALSLDVNAPQQVRIRVQRALQVMPAAPEEETAVGDDAASQEQDQTQDSADQ